MSSLGDSAAPASLAHRHAAIALITGVANDVPAQYAQRLSFGAGGVGGVLIGKTGAVNSPIIASPRAPPPPAAASPGIAPALAAALSPPNVATPLPSTTKSP